MENARSLWFGLPPSVCTAAVPLSGMQPDLLEEGSAAIAEAILAIASGLGLKGGRRRETDEGEVSAAARLQVFQSVTSANRWIRLPITTSRRRCSSYGSGIGLSA